MSNDKFAQDKAKDNLVRINEVGKVKMKREEDEISWLAWNNMVLIDRLVEGGNTKDYFTKK